MVSVETDGEKATSITVSDMSAIKDKYKDLLDAIGMSEGMRNSYINAYIAQYFQNNETTK